MRIKQKSEKVRAISALQRQQKLIEAVVSLDELRELLDASKRIRVQPVVIAVQGDRRLFVTAGAPNADWKALATKAGGDGWILMSPEVQLSRGSSLTIGGTLGNTEISARFDGGRIGSTLQGSKRSTPRLRAKLSRGEAQTLRP